MLNLRESSLSNDGHSLSSGRLLVYLIYFQAVFLAFAYAVGVWQALVVRAVSVFQPSVVMHAFFAGSFASVTGFVAVLSALRGLRKIMAVNLGLFFYIVVAASTGLALLGNPSIPSANLANISMISIVAISVPISGFSIASVSRNPSGSSLQNRPVLTLIYLGLVSLSVHMFAGVGLTSTSLYPQMEVIHFAFALLTAAFSLGVLITLLESGSLQRAAYAFTWRSAYSLVALIFVAIAAGAGGVTLLSGAIPYAVGMAEFAIVAYGFLFLSAQTPSAASSS